MLAERTLKRLARVFLYKDEGTTDAYGVVLKEKESIEVGKKDLPTLNKRSMRAQLKQQSFFDFNDLLVDEEFRDKVAALRQKLKLGQRDMLYPMTPDMAVLLRKFVKTYPVTYRRRMHLYELAVVVIALVERNESVIEAVIDDCAERVRFGYRELIQEIPDFNQRWERVVRGGRNG